MEKRKYSIAGFDCAHCASKAEAHLNKQEDISYAKIDFSTNTMYITYVGKAYSLDKVKSVIAEIETDPLEIKESGNGMKDTGKIFTKKMWWILIRVIFALVVTLVCVFLLVDYKWIRLVLYTVTIIVIAYDIFWKVVQHVKHLENILDHNLLIIIASLGAYILAILELSSGENPTREIGGLKIAMDETMEAVMVITLFQIGRIIESVATNKSKSAIMSAVQLRVETANLITEEGIKKVAPEELKVGDKIIVKVGEQIPIDGTVIDGDAFVDTSSLTGEYVPVHASKETMVYGGCLIRSGNITVRVERIYNDSTVAKIIDLISQGGEKKSKADEFIAKFAKYYTPVVVVAAILTIVIGGLISQKWMDYVYNGLEILVTGCPCAIVISVPLAYFSAVGLASKNGIVIKGSNYLDELVRMGKLVTDKTGTLTHGSFAIQKIVPIGFDEKELLDYVIAAESLSTHPIGKAICHGQNIKKIANEQKDFTELAGYGVETTYKDKRITVGDVKLFELLDIPLEPVNENGTICYCAVNHNYVGYIVLNDEVKEDAQPMVNLLHKEGVEIVLLTGDHENNAKEICEKLGIDRWHSELLPENKVDILIEEMKNTDKSVAFIGDGINDAPSIIRSDIGIAMGGIGSDVAVENADIVIMNDDPAKVYDAMHIAKMARHTSIFNIAFALTIKIVVAVLVLLQEAIPGFVIPMYVAVLADTGLTVLLVINSLLLLYRKVKRKL